MKRTFNDMVEVIHISLLGVAHLGDKPLPDGQGVMVDPPLPASKYALHLTAVWDFEAVEGSLAADDFMCAVMIREEALLLCFPEVADAKLAHITKALGVVLRRYGMDRKSRRKVAA